MGRKRKSNRSPGERKGERQARNTVGAVAGRASLWEFVCSKDALGAVLLIVAVFLAYQPVWHGGFLWDDDLHLLDNPVLKPDGLLQTWMPGTHVNYWPLTSTVYRIEYGLWGLNPLGYHLVNLALHATAALLVWRVLAELKMPGAMFAAAIFALHPVNVESAAWITQLKNTLSLPLALLSMLSFLVYERDGSRWRFAVSLGLFALSTLAKGMALTMPVVLVACVWWRHGRIERRDLLRILPFFLIAAGMVCMEVMQQHVAAGADVVRSDSLLSRIAVAGCAVWFYFWKFLWPVNLMFVYPRWPINQWTAVSFLPGILLVVILASAWRRRATWGRPVVMAIVCYVALLLPVLGFVNIYFMEFSLVADHWQYAAIIVPCAALAAGAATVVRRWPAFRPAGYAIGLALLTALACSSFLQSRMYADNETLFRTTLAQNPGCWMAHNNLGRILSDGGRSDEARQEFLAALELRPDYAEAHTNLGSILANEGRLDEALEHCRKAVEIDRHYATGYFNYANVLNRRGNIDEAIANHQKAIENCPGFAEAHNNLGANLILHGRLDEAIEQFEEAQRLNPGLPGIEQNIHAIRGRLADLHRLYTKRRELLRAQPENIAFLNDLAWTLATNPNRSLRSGAEAVEFAQRAVKLSEGRQPAILGTLAAAYAEVGRFSDAVETADRAIALASTANDAALVESLQTKIALYRARSPYREVRRPEKTAAGKPGSGAPPKFPSE